MNRRLFLNQTVAGLALCSVPFTLLPNSSFGGEAPLIIANRMALDVASAIQTGIIGNPEQLSITHVYSPERTSTSALMAVVRRDFAWAESLTGSSLPVDPRLFFSDSPSAPFGSYSVRFTAADLIVVWQGLARVGGLANAPTASLRLSGSAGTLQVSTDRRSYRFLNLQGRVIKAGTQHEVG